MQDNWGAEGAGLETSGAAGLDIWPLGSRV